jgi:hypothetical protein
MPPIEILITMSQESLQNCLVSCKVGFLAETGLASWSCADSVAMGTTYRVVPQNRERKTLKLCDNTKRKTPAATEYIVERNVLDGEDDGLDERDD